MSFHVYNAISRPETHTYKLMQLPAEVVDYMQCAGKPLQFKSGAAKNSLVLCTDASTFSVRQMKHSNTQLILNDSAVNGVGCAMSHVMSPSLVAVGQASYQYELAKIQGHVDAAGIPVYDGHELKSDGKSVQQVKEDSPIAEDAFYEAWHAIGGCEVSGQAVLLASRYVTNALYVIVSILTQDNMQTFTVEEIQPRLAAHNETYTKSVVTTVAHRFAKYSNGAFQIEPAQVATWFGIETLRSSSGISADKEFFLAWKSSLPPLFSAPLDLEALRGHYYRPTPGNVKYMDKTLLSTDLHTRVKELFNIVGSWDYDDFLAFVQDLLPVNKKPDAVILKYARKKREGKRFTMCPR